MTREIALHCMKSASELERELCEECPIYGQTGCDHCYEDALAVAIEALEQETVSKESYDHEYFLRKEFELKIDKLQHQLEQIRAELIQSIQNGTLKIESGNEELFRILDKYKAESEEA